MNFIRYFLIICAVSVALVSQAELKNVSVLIQDRHAFFKGEKEINHEMVRKFEAEIEQRRAELIGLFANIEVNKGISWEDAQKFAADEDQILALNIMLKYLKELDQAPMEKAQWIVQKILDLNYAVQTFAKPPFILQVPDIANGVIHQWTLDLNTPIEREANNLWDEQNHKYYSTSDLKTLVKKGVDLSTLNPAPNSGIWKNPGKISEIKVTENYFGGKDSLHNGLNIVFPKENVGVFQKVRMTQTSPKLNIKYVGTDGETYNAKLKFGKDMHSEPTASALFVTLGFPAEIERYYRDFKIYFKKGTSFADLNRDWATYFKGIPPILLPNKPEDFIKEMGKDSYGEFVIFRECMMELQPEGLLRAGHLDFNRNGADHWRDSRAYALLNLWIENNDWSPDNAKLVLRKNGHEDYDFHYVVHDVGCSFGGLLCEKLDKFRYHPIESVSKKKITFDFRSPRNQPTRNQATLADYKWGARLMAQLTRQQFVDIVHIGQWPDSMEKILVEKLISRRNDFVKAFGLIGEKQKDGTIITEMPVDTKLTTDDKAVVNGQVKNGKFDGYDTNFSDYWETLAWKPLLKAAKDIGKMGARKGLCEMEKIAVESIWAGIHQGTIAEGLLSICRQVIKNPKATSTDDIWLVRDSMKIGFRGGAGFVIGEDLALVKKWTLVFGARTEPEGLNARNRFLDILLPFSMRKGNLPKRYVLIREDFIIPRTRVRTDDAWWTGVGLELFDAENLMSRSVVANRGDDKLIFFKDTAHNNEAAMKLFFDLKIATIPFFKANAITGGKTHGAAWVLNAADSGSENPETSRILANIVRKGDFDEIEKVPGIKKIKIDGRIMSYTSWLFNIFGLIQSSKIERKEEIVIAPVDTAKDAYNVFHDEYLRSKGYNFFGISEMDYIRLRGYLTQKAHSNENEYDPVIMLQIILHDTNTKSNELDNGYVKFLNGFFPGSQLQFTSRLHTSDDNWGNIVVNLNMSYYHDAIDQILHVNDEQFVKHYVNQQSYDQEKIMRAWNEWYNPDSNRRNYGGDDGTQLTYLPSYLEKSLARLADFITYIRKARAEHGEKQLAYVVRALRAAVYNDKNGESLDPGLFGAINSWVSPESIYLSRNIVTPFDVENRFPGRKGLQWQTIGQDRNPQIMNMVILPEDILEIWTMFDWLKNQK